MTWLFYSLFVAYFLLTAGIAAFLAARPKTST